MIKTQIQNIKQSMKFSLDEQWTRYLLNFIGKLLTKLMGDEYPLSYSDDIFVVDQFESYREDKYLVKRREDYAFDYPEQELYMWAILLNRRNMARLFWQSSSTHIGGALVAAKILRKMSKIAEAEEELELNQDLINHSMDYQLLAKDVLTECYNKEKKKSQLLVVRELPNWGHTTCLSIADSAFLMEFMDHSCCQTKLNRIWKGNMHLHTSWWRLLLAMIPFLIFLVRFSADDEELEVTEKESVHQETIAGANTCSSPARPQLQKRLTTLSTSDQVVTTQRHQPSRKIRQLGFHTVENKLSIFRAIWYYYTAPVTKFMFNVLSYIVFLVIFSHFMLTDLRPISHPESPGKWEWVTIVWVFSLTVEEGRQIFVREPRSLKYKIISWYDDIWNRFDLAMILMFSMSLILRFSLDGAEFMIARISYSLTLMVFMFRLLHMGFFHKEIGPKIIMIKQMVQDLVYFVAVLIVFIMAFGVACEALLYPNHDPTLMLIPKVVYKPYWQMYGELFLEEIEGRLDNETCYSEPRLDGHCPPMDDNYRWVVPLLTGVYMLISNVLLLNLLIAMFSYIFQKVNDKSETIWRFYRFELVYEYFDRPTLIPPFILLNHAWRAIWWVIHKCQGNETPSTNFKVRLDEDEIMDLNGFERRQVENYFIKKHHRDMLIPEVRMQRTGKRLDKVIEEIEDIRESLTGRWTETNAIGLLVRGSSSGSLHETPRRPLARRAITDSTKLKQFERSESIADTIGESETGTAKDDLEERVEKMETNISEIMNVLKSLQTSQQQLLEGQRQARDQEKKTEIYHIHHAPSRQPQPVSVQQRSSYQSHKMQGIPPPQEVEEEVDEDIAERDLFQYLPPQVTFRDQLLRGPGSVAAVPLTASQEESVSSQSQMSYRDQLLQGITPTLYTNQSDDDVSPPRVDYRSKSQPSPSTMREQLLQGLATRPSGLRPADGSVSDTLH
ncbi:transient receptor potential cation channel subfamily M member-like 2 isoform X2 [Ptychodera flava]|uniref:transient receptor potential cation channel subfamily M member-like 2 isoform X2 n=1 Tax=Ptychodera flava TaxID=63121 RepID=UPI00396A66C9